MSHLDEGTLNALLDGELADHEVRAIQAHLGGCASCGTRLKSVKEMLTESDRLVGALQFPGTPRRPPALEPEADAHAPEPVLPPDPAEGAGSQRPRPPRPERRLEPVYDEAPPVLLVPDNSQWDDRRRKLLLGMRWAALVLVAAGAGYLANEVRRAGAAPQVSTYFRDEPTAEPEPVVSAEETPARPDTGGAPAAGPPTSPAPAAGQPDDAEPVENARARQPQPRAQAAAPASLTVAETVPASVPAPAQAVEDTGAEDQAAADETEPAAEEPPAPSVREEAAKALAELDRERQMERAAAATAALDTAGEPRVEAQRRMPTPAAAPAPVPRTLEQRSQTYLRIGLDEAARQLGRPVHVIEGMSPQFMGLAQGSTSVGADAARPVVRVVYQDSRGRMILLDQQRIRPGQEWGAGATRWVQGEIGLVLHGEAGPEVLRNLRPRVR